MADQSVRVTNLPDSGTPERVAYDLWFMLRSNVGEGKKGPERIKAFLDLYAACLTTVRMQETPNVSHLT